MDKNQHSEMSCGASNNYDEFIVCKECQNLNIYVIEWSI